MSFACIKLDSKNNFLVESAVITLIDIISVLFLKLFLVVVYFLGQ